MKKKYILDIIIITLMIFVNIMAVMIWKDESLQKYQTLETTLQKIMKHPASESYTCVNYSEDLVAELRSQGIQAETVVGWGNGERDKRHEWVAIWFEPQSGTFTSGYEKIQ